MSADLTNLVDTIEAWRMAKAEIAKWKEVVEASAEKILAAMGDEEVATVNGRKALTNTKKTVTRVNTRALRGAIPEEVLAPYLVTTEERAGLKPVD